MKASNAGMSDNMNVSSAQLAGPDTPIQGQIIQGKLNPQMQSSYHRVMPQQMQAAGAAQGNNAELSVS